MTSSSSWWSSPPWASTSPTVSTTPATRWRPRSPPGAQPPRIAVGLSGGAQPGGRLPVAQRRRDDRQRPGRHRAGHADRGLRRPGRRHHLEPADLAARHPVQLVARADRRRHRLDASPPPAGTRSSGTAWSPRSSFRPGSRRSSPALVAGDRHLAAVPDQPEHVRRCAQPRLPDRPDRLGVAGLARARHQRRAEDHGRHHAGADRQPHHRRHGDHARSG